MGFLDEMNDKKQLENEKMDNLARQVKNLKTEVEMLIRQLEGYQTANEQNNKKVFTDMDKHLQQAVESALKPLQKQLMESSKAKENNGTKDSDIKTELKLIGIAFLIFCIPTFLSGWCFKADNTATQMILWNQTYPDSKVNPFDSKKDFTAKWDNQGLTMNPK